jgi:FdhE protein
VSATTERARTRSQEIARTTPQWRPWLRRLDAAIEEDAARRFDAMRVVLDPHPTPRAPRLRGARLEVPRGAAVPWLARSLGRAVARRHGLDALAFAVQGDATRLEALAVVVGRGGDGLAARAAACAVPVLHAFRRRVEGGPRTDAVAGTCPTCGAWPSLAESRGLERARRLRCGRCGDDWPHAWLRCVFCGEDDHRKQGSLVPESGGEARRVETCASCRGYVKTTATVGGLAPESVPLEDLATVDLDVAAIDRGFRRPAAPVVPCTVVLVEDGAAR